MWRDWFISHSHPDQNPKHHKSLKAPGRRRAARAARMQRRSVWNCLPLHCVCTSVLRSFGLLHLLVGFQFVPVAVLYSAVQRILTADQIINQPFPPSFALWLCWDFIGFINVLLGEAFLHMCQTFPCRRLQVFMSVSAIGHCVTHRMSGTAGQTWVGSIPKVVLKRLHVLSDQTQATWDSARQARASATAAKLPWCYLSMYCICSIWLLCFCYFSFFCWFYKRNHSSMSQSHCLL